MVSRSDCRAVLLAVLDHGERESFVQEEVDVGFRRTSCASPSRSSGGGGRSRGLEIDGRLGGRRVCFVFWIHSANPHND